MRLQRLTLRHFKGIREFTLDARGGDVAVYGDNATGKTSLADAFMWLLFGRDSLGQTDFSVKTLGADGQPVHHLEHEAEAVLDVGGREITLRKVLAEKWTKRRGKLEQEFDGHATSYWVDGVPVQLQDYRQRVGCIASEETFRLLTDPSHFAASLHWGKRRAMLIEVCGGVADADVIAADAELRDLPGILNGRSLDDHRAVLGERRKTTNKELEKIPVRIDEATRALPEAGGDANGLRAEAVRLREERYQRESKRVGLLQGGAVARQQVLLRQAEAEMLAVETKLRRAAEERAQQERARRRAAEDQVEAARREVRQLEDQGADAATTIAWLEKALEAKRAEWRAMEAERTAWTAADVCAACGQALPPERVEEARRAFNLSLAARLEANQADGTQLRARQDGLFARRWELQAQHEAARQTLAAAEAATATRDEVAPPALESDPEYRRARAARDAAQAEIDNLQAGNAAAVGPVEEAIRNLDAQIAAAEGGIGRIEARAVGLARIEDLKAQERRLADEFGRTERELYMTDLFIRTRVRLLEERINIRFRLARFKLFEVQVNGAVGECCEVAVNGVPYSDLNHGARLNVGIDCINTLAEHYGIDMPVWVDNAEAVTQILPGRGQMIKLIVSAEDKALRVERQAGALAAAAKGAM